MRHGFGAHNCEFTFAFTSSLIGGFDFKKVQVELYISSNWMFLHSLSWMISEIKFLWDLHFVWHNIYLPSWSIQCRLHGNKWTHILWARFWNRRCDYFVWVSVKPGTPRNTPEHPGTPRNIPGTPPEQSGTARNNPGTPLEHPIIPQNIP